MIFNSENFNEEYLSYKNSIELFSALSYLFSESDIPYLHYRNMENIFCSSFEANNLSRTDTAFDANKKFKNTNYGVGLKTFIAPPRKDGITEIKQEKIAEFNKESVNLKDLSIKDMTLKIAELRNARLNSAIKEYDINESLYHCAIRYHENDDEKSGKVLLKEFPYEAIDANRIICTDKNYQPLSSTQILEKPSEHLYFIEEGTENFYSFNRSKSTLLKRFDTTLDNGIIIPVTKLEDPLQMLQEWFLTVNLKKDIPGVNYVILPLYSTLKTQLEKFVPEKSGLNQWNAGGRIRKFGEMYIPVPSFIHHYCPGFFPSRDKEFSLITPNNTEISSSLCQDGAKALMSNPNRALSEWFHPLLMKYNRESIVTYDDLKRIGKDSVRIEKLAENQYKFSLAPIGSWEEFKLKIEQQTKK